MIVTCRTDSDLLLNISLVRGQLLKVDKSRAQSTSYSSTYD